MTLSPEDLARIEAEERARHEVRQRIAAEEQDRVDAERLALVDPDRQPMTWTVAMLLGLFAIFNIAASAWVYFYGSPLRWWAY
jgi:hypothetical protein